MMEWGKALARHAGRAYRLSRAAAGGTLFATLFAALFALSPACLGAAPEAPQYHHTAWSTQEGAPADIWALAQGQDGYLWLGTGTGLYRFDGVRFERYLPAKEQQFASRNITALHMSPGGELWIGFLLGGASVLRDGRLVHYRVQDGAPTGMVVGFAEDRDGTLWAASQGGLYRFRDRHWTRVGSEWNYPGDGADAVLLDRQGDLWVTTGATLVRLPRGQRRFQPTQEKIGGSASLAEASDGTLWLSDGLHGTRVIPDARRPDRTPRTLATTQFARLANMRIDRWGVLWGTDRTGGGVMRASALDKRGQGDSLRPEDIDLALRKRDGLSSDKAVPVLEDREGNIWVGTNLGLHRFRRNNVHAVLHEALTQQTTYAIAATAEGLLVSSGPDLYRLQGNHPQWLAAADTRNVAGIVVSAGQVWLSSQYDLWKLENGVPRLIPRPHAQDALLALLESDGDGGVLAMWEEQGLHQFDGRRWRRIGADTLPSRRPTAMVRDPRGGIWIGYPGSVLAHWDGRRQKIHSIGGAGWDVGAITALAVVEDAILITGETGLAAVRHGRVQRIRSDPADQLLGVTGIVADADAVWFNGMRGVAKAAMRDLRRAWEGAGDPLPVRVFDMADGLPGLAQQATVTPTALRDANGRLWFATNQGVAWIDPNRLHQNDRVPPVAIRELVAGGRSYALAPGLRLPKGTRDLRIDYTALSLSVPERVRMRYRLSGVDSDWQDAGDRRQTFYTNLGPGQYRFQVTAANDSGVWNPVATETTFEIEPRFVETWWFVLLCVAGVAASLFVLYLWRLRQIAGRLRARLEERHRERERIARELHDTLLQGVQGLALRFQAIANGIPPQDATRKAMEKALDRVDDVIEEARDRVRDLRDASSAISLELPEAFAHIGNELSEVHPVDFSVVVEGHLPKIDPLVRDEIYRIGREALVNAFHHGNPGRVEVEISYDRELLRLRFRDDGQGMSGEVQHAGSRAGHWGLSGMRERANGIGAELNIWSRPGLGTEVELKLPAAAQVRSPAQDWRRWLAALWTGTRHAS